MNVAVWGCGELGRHIAKQHKGSMQVKFFIDNDTDKLNSYLDNIKVIPANDLKSVYLKEIEAVIIGVVSMTNAASILAQLHELAVDNVGIFKKRISVTNRIDWSDLIWINRKSKPVLPYLETNIIDVCNLQCAGCTHFANLFEAKSDYKLTVFKKDITQIANKMMVLQLRLLGGEPLLHNDLLEYIRFAKSAMPQTDIRLVSNGILVPQQNKEFFDCVRENAIKIDISLYPPTVEMKEKIIAVLEDNKIRYGFSNEINEFYRTLRADGKSNPVGAYKKCQQKHCHFLRNGRLYTCPYEALIHKYVEYYSLHDTFCKTGELGTNIYEDALCWEDMFINLCRPIELCKHCSEQGGEFFNWKVARKPEKEDWLVNQNELKDL